jgi:hypothetical protein
MNTKNAILASAVASLFLSGAAFAAKDAEKKTTVKCAGINSCSGKGSCASADNSCSGKNSCNGKGWSPTATEKECTTKGGKVLASADAPKMK